MRLHPVLTEKLNAVVAEVVPASLTRRDAQLPTVPRRFPELRGKQTVHWMLDPRAARRILVLTSDQLPARSEAGVDVQPAYQWLLDDA